MSYSLGLGADRPAPAGILAFSGFIPTVEGWDVDLDGREHLPVFITHGRQDPVISVDFARHAAATLQAAGLPVEYLETEYPHAIPPEAVERARDAVATAIGGFQ
jgi:phospholipase/carboxylesterase